MTTKALVIDISVVEKIIATIEKAVSEVPKTNETYLQFPEERVSRIIMSASFKSAAYSTTLALPPGPLGVLTIIPDLYLIWKIQAQMVADIAGVYGRDCNLTKEHMIYCLFKQVVFQIARDVAVRFGTRMLVKSISSGMMKQIFRKIGINIAKKSANRAVSKWIPVIGVLGAGAYSFYDTKTVGENARELFKELSVCA